MLPVFAIDHFGLAIFHHLLQEVGRALGGNARQVHIVNRMQPAIGQGGAQMCPNGFVGQFIRARGRLSGRRGGRFVIPLFES